MTTALVSQDRWSADNLAKFRANKSSTIAQVRSYKRKKSDATIAKHVALLEEAAAANGGYVPSYKRLEELGLFTSYMTMLDYPAAFAHLPREADKKFEIYQAHNGEILPPLPPVILPPNKEVHDLSAYNVNGAHFNPTELVIDAGLAEGEWMQVGRMLAHVCQSALWWVGDLLLYGFQNYGKKASYDLAQQATSFTRSALYTCAYVAKRFPPHRRVAALTFHHHLMVARFDPELADRLLAEAVQLGYTGRQLSDMAQDEIGETEETSTRTDITVKLRKDVVEKLEALAEAQDKSLAIFAAGILEDYAFVNWATAQREKFMVATGNIHGVDITDADLPEDFIPGAQA
jgi:hypothetical protein